MYYKNYWINYVSFGEDFICAICNQDMTNFVNTDTDKDYMHIKSTFFINRYQWEHAKDYLDENELFMSIFPLDVVEDSIKEWNDEQNENNKKFHEIFKQEYKYPISEEFFKKAREKNKTLKNILSNINTSNKLSKEYWGVEFPIEKYYKDILIKYWGDYKI